jgi:nicotinamide-nucleotide amidase
VTAQPTAEVIAVGDELLRGDTVDTNGAWIGRTLAGIGIEVRQRTVVGDQVDQIRDAMRAAVPRVGLLVVCGGLGPTADDLTRDALADLLGEPLLLDEALLQRLAEYFADRQRSMPAGAVVQAMRPSSAWPIHNQVGTAPGLRATCDGCTVLLLPGPPRELQPMLTGLLPQLPSAAPSSARRLTVALLPESLVAELVEPLLGEATAAYYATPGRVVIRLTGATEAVAAATARAAAVLGDVLLDRADAAESVLAAAERRGWSVAVAESLTGGLVTASLTAVAGASAVVRGGIVSYATEVKDSLLDVPAELLDARGPVDPEVALAMARGARRALDADVAVATTGVAGPDPVGPHPPGLAFVAVSSPEDERVVRVDARGDRELVRTLTVAHALDLLRRSLNRLPDYSATAEPG